MLDLNTILAKFKPISLEEMDNVKLMNRMDNKFLIHIEKLYPLIERIESKYQILEIEGRRLFHYQTIYYDTATRQMYYAHHNNRLNRFKIRYREYLDTKTAFLEIKYKTNKDRTIKERIKQKADLPFINHKNEKFISKKTGYKLSDLVPSLINRFSRFTLVNTEDKVRITIDMNLSFVNKEDTINMSNLVILEVKQEKSSNSEFLRLLHEFKIYPRSISKYCVGTVLFNKEIKYNRFKKNLLILKKIINDYKFPHLSN